MQTVNSDNVYNLTCKVSGQNVKTTPVQFKALVAQYGLTADEVQKNYVSRHGRNVIKNRSLTKEAVINEFGIPEEILAQLKCFNTKPLGKRALAKLAKAQETRESAPESTETASNEPATEDEVMFVAEDDDSEPATEG